MYNLPLESKLDIFKHLNINQLTSVRQTNNYFNALIGRYEGELARKDFHFINLGELSRSNYYNDDQFVNIEDGVFELKITSQLMEKWQSAVDKQIPLYLNISEDTRLVIRTHDSRGNFIDTILNLPLIPKNIEEVKIIRCWIERISRCYFNFFDLVFNPKMLQLLFDKEEIDKLKFNCESFNCYNVTVADESVLLFYLDRLVISESIWFNYNRDDNKFKQDDILFKFLLKVPYVSINNSTQSTLCKLILKYIETSKDYSNITFNEIRFYLMWWDLFNLSERAELIEKSKPYHSFKYTYHLTNIHNPNVKFSIYFIEHIDTIGLFRIERING
ncbi:hypothetical protein ACQ4LE_006568 [Meloidogyne hapla]